MVVVLIILAALTTLSSFYSSGIQVILTTFSLGRGTALGRVLKLNLLYILSIFSLMLLVGLGLLYLVTLASQDAWAYILALAGACIFMGGWLKVYAYFSYHSKRRPQITILMIHQAQKLATKAKKTIDVFLLGGFVTLLELAWTIALYVVVAAMIYGYAPPPGYELILIYCLLTVVPLLVIVYLLATGTKVSGLKRWHDNNKKLFTLIMGLLMLGLGSISIVIANGGINLG